MNRDTTCAFTGHRPDKLPWGENEQDPRCLALKVRIAHEVARAYDEGYRHFICGMARGADFFFCEAVIALKKEHSDVSLEAAIPCEEQAARWPEAERNRYFRLAEQCDFETLVQHRYTAGCMQRRNRYMVDQSARIIAAYDGMLGGTLYTLTYAMREKLETVIIDTPSP